MVTSLWKKNIITKLFFVLISHKCKEIEERIVFKYWYLQVTDNIHKLYLRTEICIHCYTVVYSYACKTKYKPIERYKVPA